MWQRLSKSRMRGLGRGSRHRPYHAPGASGSVVLGKGLWEFYVWVYLHVKYGVIQTNDLPVFRKQRRVFSLPSSKLVDPTLSVTIHRKAWDTCPTNCISRRAPTGRWTSDRLTVMAFESTAGLLMAAPAPQGEHTAWVYLSSINFWGWTFQTLRNSGLIRGHKVFHNFYMTLSLKSNALPFEIILPWEIILSKLHGHMQPHYSFLIWKKKFRVPD